MPRRNNTISLDEEWCIFPVNINKVHWVCLVTVVLYTSNKTQVINIYYIDSLESEHWEDSVKEHVPHYLCNCPHVR